MSRASAQSPEGSRWSRGGSPGRRPHSALGLPVCEVRAPAALRGLNSAGGAWLAARPEFAAAAPARSSLSPRAWGKLVPTPGGPALLSGPACSWLLPTCLSEGASGILRWPKDLRAADSGGGKWKGLLSPGSRSLLADLPSGDSARPQGEERRRRTWLLSRGKQAVG